MSDIRLTQGQTATVDEDAYLSIAEFKWFAYWNKTAQSFYAGRMTRNEDGTRYMVLMHRQIMSAARNDGPIDHINGNGLDNRKSNLRFASTQQNCSNRRLARNNRSGVTGVRYIKSRNKWEASIRVNFKLLFLGRFDRVEDAIAKRKSAEIEHFGGFAPTGRS